MNRCLRIALSTIVLATSIGRGDESVAPYVPTVEEDVALMLEVGDVGPHDYVIDLGSGDGRIVIAAAGRGASGHGVELDRELVDLSVENALAASVDDRVAFVEGDIFDADIELATVVTLYLFPEANLMLRPKLLAELEPGTRIVSNSFDMGDWVPDTHDMTARSSGGILLWIVPAPIEGVWTVEAGGARWEISASQRYQRIELDAALAEVQISDAHLRGDRISFTAAVDDERYRFSGQIDGGSMAGYVRIERSDGISVERWAAQRLPE